MWSAFFDHLECFENIQWLQIISRRLTFSCLTFSVSQPVTISHDFGTRLNSGMGLVEYLNNCRCHGMSMSMWLSMNGVLCLSCTKR